ncbi:MAG: alpha/beta hydrolase [Gemmatimonadota bacterium]
MIHRLRTAACAVLILSVVACTPATEKAGASDSTTAPAPVAAIPYGANAAASGTFEHDGVKLYYETYGAGEPLLLVHGNGGSIGTFGVQIEHFKQLYRVIAMDSRDQGRSSDSDGPITYEEMTDDLAALIDHLQLDSVSVLGWSDGGIEALLLGIRYPTKVRKLVAMAANLNPSAKAIYPETEELVKAMLAGMTDSMKNTPQGKRDFKVTSTMLKEPHIAPAMLGQIKAPTLILGGDHDLITLEHLVEMFNHIPNAQLAIFPNSTHMVPFDDPAMFNATVDRFLSTPFVKLDRIPATMASLEKLLAGTAH